MKNLSFVDFTRKALHWLLRSTVHRVLLFFRRLRMLFVFKSWIANCGRNIVVAGLPLKIDVPRRITISDNCIFEFGPESNLSIGSSCYLSYGVVISCMKGIRVGENVQIGEYSSIRDTTHQYKDLQIPIKEQKDISTEIVIGDDVWIGRGCIIMPGSLIGRGAIIGANSVVTGEIEDYAVYAGAPAKFIKSRKDK